MASDGLGDILDVEAEEEEEDEAALSIWRAFLATFDFGELLDRRLRSFR